MDEQRKLEDAAFVQSLFAENVLVVNRDLVCALGVDEAFIIGQIRYWMKSNREHGKHTHYRDGHWWTFNTYQDWRENNFPWMSIASIRRAINDLETHGLIISTSEYNRRAYDDTKWYTINEAAVVAFFKLWYQHFKPINYGRKESNTQVAYKAFIEDWKQNYETHRYGHFDITPTKKAAAQFEHPPVQIEQTYTRDYYRDEKKRALPEQIGNGRDEHQSHQRDVIPSKPDTFPTSQSVGEKKKDTPPPKPRPRDALFDAIAQHVFGVSVDDKHKVNVIGGRIAKVRAFAANGQQNQLDAPATDQHIREFVGWYTRKYPTLSVPRDVAKFAEHWFAWRAENPRGQTTPPTSRYVLADEQDAPQTSAPMWE